MKILCRRNLRSVPQHFIKEFHAARQISEVQIYIIGENTVHSVLMMLQSVLDNPVCSALHFFTELGQYRIVCHLSLPKLASVGDKRRVTDIGTSLGVHENTIVPSFTQYKQAMGYAVPILIHTIDIGKEEIIIAQKILRKIVKLCGRQFHSFLCNTGCR